MWSNCCAVNADRCYNSVYNCVCLRLKLCLPFSETSLFKYIGTIITGVTGKQFSHSIFRPNQLPNENQTTTNQTTSIKLARNCSKEHIPSNTSQFVPWSKLSNLSALHLTLPISKIRKRLYCIYRQIISSKHIKIHWFSDCRFSRCYLKFPTTLAHLRE